MMPIGGWLDLPGNASCTSMKRLLVFGFFTAVLALGSQPSHAQQELFTEQKDTGTIVIWKDITIPKEKSYETVVVMQGRVDFFGSTKTLVVIDGGVVLNPDSEVSERLLVVHGQVKQLKGAKVVDLNRMPPFRQAIEDFLTKIRGRFSRLPFDPMNLFFWKMVWWPLSLSLLFSALILILVLGYLFFRLAPQLSLSADEGLRLHYLSALVWGLIAHLAFFPFLILLAISIIGIPFIPFVILLAFLVGFAGLFAVARCIGSFVLRPNNQSAILGPSLLGLLILFGLLFIPLIGKILVFLAHLAGIGAVLRSLTLIRSAPNDKPVGILTS